MSLLTEFKAFAMRGNVVDLAIGVIIGAAFGRVVSSAVSDVLMPPIGKLMGGVDFRNLFISLDPALTEGINVLAKAQETGATVISIGLFINTIIDFTIVAAVMFMVVRMMMKMQKQAAVEVSTKECPHCLSHIPLAATRCAHCTSQL